MPAPLAGIRVLDYSQFVAGPLATMLLADLGADVIKIEHPRGDAYRDYEPLGHKRSRRFYALNRGKRSLVLDLTTPTDRARSAALIKTADVLVHNMPAPRARRFGLDPDTVRALNPGTVVSRISAFGSRGPLAANPGYDLIAQAHAGLLLADPRPGQDVPRRSGHIPLADITAGLLTALSVLTGLYTRRTGQGAPDTEVSLLGAALLTQVQDLVRLDNDPPAEPATPALLAARAEHRRGHDDLEPYYGCYRTADGYLALACLNATQRRRVGETLGLADPWADNPQQPPADQDERRLRASTKLAVADRLRAHPTAHWTRVFAAAGVPCTEVRTLEAAFTDQQVRANHLTQRVHQPGVGDVELYGSVFHIDGEPLPPAVRPAPELNEHHDQLPERSPRCT